MASNALPPDVSHAAVPSKRVFLPWHKPRKQFIREHQWGKAAEQLINNMNSDVVNYFTLPGRDFLDVITLGKTCEKLGKKLKFLGFDNSSEAADRFAQAIEFFDVNGRTLPICESSNPLNYKIEDIAIPNSKPQREFVVKGPYHIVNLDTCSSFANKEYFRDNCRTVDALKVILEKQFTKCGHDWLLFLTTNVSHQNFTQETFTQLMAATIENAKNSKEFAARAKEALRLSPDTVLQNTVSKLPNVESENFVRQCTLGISKWILHLLQGTQNDQWEIEVVDAYFYSTGHVPDMLSIAFKFKRLEQTVHDKSDLTFNHDLDSSEDLPSSDVRLACRLSHMKNLDTKLQENPNCFEKMFLKSAELLASLNYQTGENHKKYRDWCNDFNP